MAKSNPYLMESALEAARLEAKTDVHVTRRQLRWVGLKRGMAALDAGAGTGAVARVMAQKVGAEGRVVAFDLSDNHADMGRRLAKEENHQNFEFVVGDLLQMPFPSNSFDFVWSRFVFEYFPQPEPVLSELIRVARPGGKIVVGDIDGYGAFHHPLPPETEELIRKFEQALAPRFDPYSGRKLFHRFRQAGLENIKVRVCPYHLYAGPAGPRDLYNWELKFRTLRRWGVEALGEATYDRFVRSFLAVLSDPDALTYSTLFLVEGTKKKGSWNEQENSEGRDPIR